MKLFPPNVGSLFALSNFCVKLFSASINFQTIAIDFLLLFSGIKAQLLTPDWLRWLFEFIDDDSGLRLNKIQLKSDMKSDCPAESIQFNDHYQVLRRCLRQEETYATTSRPWLCYVRFDLQTLQAQVPACAIIRSGL